MDMQIINKIKFEFNLCVFNCFNILLENNIKEEIKKDFINNRTIWIGRRIYTYAELKDL